MITVTLTFKEVPHQAVLLFQDEASMELGLRGLSSAVVCDDFGHTVTWTVGALAFITQADLGPHWKGENIKSMAKMRADRDLKVEVQSSTDLDFLVDERRPHFGRT